MLDGRNPRFPSVSAPGPLGMVANTCAVVFVAHPRPLFFPQPHTKHEQNQTKNTTPQTHASSEAILAGGT